MQGTTFESDIDVLNYALTLEHLEAALYAEAANFEFGVDGFGNSIDDWLVAVGDHENAHVEMLTQAIADLGGEPVEAGTHAFGLTDAASFLATAAAIENVGVAAYDGAGASLESADLLTSVGGIVAVEARHAAYLNLLIGESPFPSAVEAPMAPDAVLDLVTPFVSGGEVDAPEGATPPS